MTDYKEAFHIKNLHWVDVPASGSCPGSHPNKRNSPAGQTRCYTNAAAAALRGSVQEQEISKLTNERSKLRPARSDNLTERCGFCKYFNKPTTCQIVEGPVAADQVCDWIFSRETDAGLYNISDEDWIAFGKGMINKQPYQHIVKDVEITPAGPLVMIEDTSDPKHRFSLDKEFHVAHTSLEHHWTQKEVDDLVSVGKSESVQEQERPSLKTQTFILSKERFKTEAQARKWMKDNNRTFEKIDETETSFRFRQFKTDRCQDGTSRTFDITDGVKSVGCRLKPEFRENESLFEKYDGRLGPTYKLLKAGKVSLTEDERSLVMERKAVWHHGPNGEETPAVWKSVVNGKTWFVTNTHRAYNVTVTLKGTIERYHRFIRMTASSVPSDEYYISDESIKEQATQVSE